MKKASLLSLVILFFLYNRTEAQNIEPKYLEVIHYFKEIKKDSSFNISPWIEFLGINFSLDSLGACHCNIDSLRKEHIETYSFEPYIDVEIKKAYANDRMRNRYLVFSKPIGTILSVSMRKGNVHTMRDTDIYFGTTDEFLFLFDPNNKIIKVLQGIIHYN